MIRGRKSRGLSGGMEIMILPPENKNATERIIIAKFFMRSFILMFIIHRPLINVFFLSFPLRTTSIVLKIPQTFERAYPKAS